MGRAAVVPGLSACSISDSRFRLAVESSYIGTDGDLIMAEAVLVAVAAPLPPTYPLATVQMRTTPASLPRALAWDAFRNGTVIDDELLRRGTRPPVGRGGPAL